MREFNRQHVAEDGLRAMYRSALEQSEQHECDAWINYVRARAARIAVEQDLERVTRTPREGE